MTVSECKVLRAENTEDLNKQIADAIADGMQPMGSAYAIAIAYGESRHAITMCREGTPVVARKADADKAEPRAKKDDDDDDKPEHRGKR